MYAGQKFKQFGLRGNGNTLTSEKKNREKTKRGDTTETIEGMRLPTNRSGEPG